MLKSRLPWKISLVENTVLRGETIVVVWCTTFKLLAIHLLQ